MKYIKIALSFLIMINLFACFDNSNIVSTLAEPVNIEQYLLKERGLNYDNSDYKKIIRGDLDISEYSEFAYNPNNNTNSILLDNGKFYDVDLKNLLINDKCIMDLNFLGKDDILSWKYDGMENVSVYFDNDNAYEINLKKQSVEKIDAPLYNKIYRLDDVGRLYEDTHAFEKALKIYDFDMLLIALFEKKMTILYSFAYFDKETYSNNDKREFIAFDLEMDEYPVRIFNSNILMTNCSFYEIIYISAHKNNNDNKDDNVTYYNDLGLRKIDTLTCFYKDVRNITNDYVISRDYTLLPLNEVIIYNDNSYKYDCCNFYYDNGI